MNHLDAVRIQVTRAVLSVGLLGRKDFHGAALVHAHPPLRDVEMVRAPIGNHPAAVFAVIAPIGKMLVHAARAEFGMVRAHRRGTQPHIPIQSRLVRLAGQIARHARAADGDFDVLDLADGAVADEFARDAKLFRGTLHAAGLEDAFVFANGVHHGARFVDGLAEGLLAINVLAGFRRGDGNQRMPMVGRGDHDSVDVFAREEFAEILVSVATFGARGGCFLRVMLIDSFPGELAAGGIDVTYGNHARVFRSQMPAHQAAALSADTDATDGQQVVWFGFGSPDAGGQNEGRSGASDHGGANKTAA